MKAAAFQGSYCDLRFVKSRSVAQITVEIPIERAADFVAVFGAPNPAVECPVALARIDLKAAHKAPETNDESKSRRKFDDLAPATQAGIRCAEPAFWRYLSEEVGEPRRGEIVCAAITDENGAADAVRQFCGVGSRSDLNKESGAAASWARLNSQYELWMRAPI